jgi:CBS domain-containing protein
MVGREMLTAPAMCLYEDDDVEDAKQLMERNQIRRLVILERGTEKISGVVSLGDLARNADKKSSGEVLQKVSEPA